VLDIVVEKWMVNCLCLRIWFNRGREERGYGSGEHGYGRRYPDEYKYGPLLDVVVVDAGVEETTMEKDAVD
jgi:hypothetical protein